VPSAAQVTAMRKVLTSADSCAVAHALQVAVLCPAMSGAAHMALLLRRGSRGIPGGSMTTSHAASTNTRDVVVCALNRCIEADLDAQRGFAATAADVRDQDLKALLRLRSDERAALVVALQQAVRELGGWAENRGTLEGTLHRLWIETRVAVEGPSDASILVECERGERRCLASYETLLAVAGFNARLPYSLRALIAKQHGIVRASLADLGARLGSDDRPVR
jgi:uncharacterized protein (TIGR02284 family)